MAKAKKIILIVVLFIVYIALGINLLFKWFPRDWTSDSLTVTADKICEAYKGNHNIWIFESSLDGKETDVEICPIGGQDAETYVSSNENSIFVFAAWLDQLERHAAFYGKEGNFGTYTELAQVNLTDTVDISFYSFKVFGDVLVVLGLDQMEDDVIILTYQEGNITEKRIKTNLHFVDGSLQSDGFYGLDITGKVYFCDMDGMIKDVGLENVAYLTASRNGIFYQHIDDSVLHYKSYDGTVHKEYKGFSNVNHVRTGIDGNSIAISMWDGSVISIDEYGNYITSLNTIEIRIIDIVLQILPLWFLYTICFIAVSIGIYILFHCIVLSKKMLIQAISFMAVTSIIWIIVMMNLLLTYDENVDTSEAYAILYTDNNILISRFIEQIEESGLRYDEAIKDKAFLTKVFASEQTNIMSDYPFQEDLLLDNGKDIRIVYSQAGVQGVNIENSVLRDLTRILPEKYEQHTYFLDEVKIEGVEYYLYAESFGNVGNKLYMITRLPVHGINVSKEGLLKYSYLLIGAWFVIALGFSIAFYYIWRPVKLVNSQLEKMAKGDYSINSHGIFDNEIGDIWISLDVLCKNLSFKDYKKNNTLEAVLQYAPMHFEKLFDRTKLQDVLVGESTSIHTTVGMISVIDKEVLVEGKIQQSYLKYVNMLLNILVEQDKREEVVLLQNDGNMEGVKMIFTDNTEDKNAVESVYYGISCMEAILAKTQDIYEVNPFVVLHTSEFNCGVAGGSGHAYPFVSGTDMDILNTYIDRLRQCAISMVVTEQTYKLLQNKFSTRYIGYVTAMDNKSQLKLYEILDACETKAKKEKLVNDDLFQQGISLYCAYEYNRARNSFVEYLKLCPEDGLAAWYLLACENGLTHNETQQDTSLFGYVD